eukprot:CAMPEP_0183588476 /NCGR_PEP_ID=MMETSP0371-20130417/160842_1 /TAXON_ID=268820 /ORGANISM="Peridinium aciculiferum, Strain PAER-2" /LENGTH=42 /DNA_ID= /DNA_START= /DNA_END= /DNA_ORIENTATION=
MWWANPKVRAKFGETSGANRISLSPRAAAARKEASSVTPVAV